MLNAAIWDKTRSQFKGGGGVSALDLQIRRVTQDKLLDLQKKSGEPQCLCLMTFASPIS